MAKTTDSESSDSSKANRPWFKKKRFIIPIAVVLIAAGASAANGGGNNSATSGSSSSSEGADESTSVEQPEESSNPKIGEPAVDGDLTFTVSGIECGITSVGTELLGAKAQGQFCRVSLNVQNNGKEAKSIFADSWTAYDAEEREFSADTGSMIYDGEQIWFEEINPGNTVSGGVLFDVPADTTLTSIKLTESMFSGGVVVDLQ